MSFLNISGIVSIIFIRYLNKENVLKHDKEVLASEKANYSVEESLEDV